MPHVIAYVAYMQHGISSSVQTVRDTPNWKTGRIYIICIYILEVLSSADRETEASQQDGRRIERPLKRPGTMLP